MNEERAIPGDMSFDEDNLRFRTTFKKRDETANSQEADLVDWPFRALRHMLVPIDLTSDAPETVRYAIHLARDFGSRITLLHVYQPPMTLGNPVGNRATIELLKDHRQVEEALKTQGATVREAYANCEWILRSGDPGLSILEVARELSVDLILISSHHRHWIDRYRQTNDIAHILHYAPCPVLTVSDDGQRLLNYPDPTS
jgi:nucleotide-binding universal stress UspA family protein